MTWGQCLLVFISWVISWYAGRCNGYFAGWFAHIDLLDEMKKSDNRSRLVSGEGL